MLAHTGGKSACRCLQTACLLLLALNTHGRVSLSLLCSSHSHGDTSGTRADVPDRGRLLMPTVHARPRIWSAALCWQQLLLQQQQLCTSSLPPQPSTWVQASFGFVDDMRRKSSGAASASLMLSHWERLQVPPAPSMQSASCQRPAVPLRVTCSAAQHAPTCPKVGSADCSSAHVHSGQLPDLVIAACCAGRGPWVSPGLIQQCGCGKSACDASDASADGPCVLCQVDPFFVPVTEEEREEWGEEGQGIGSRNLARTLIDEVCDALLTVSACRSFLKFYLADKCKALIMRVQQRFSQKHAALFLLVTQDAGRCCCCFMCEAQGCLLSDPSAGAAKKGSCSRQEGG